MLQKVSLLKIVSFHSCVKRILKITSAWLDEDFFLMKNTIEKNKNKRREPLDERFQNTSKFKNPGTSNVFVFHLSLLKFLYYIEIYQNNLTNPKTKENELIKQNDEM